MFLQGKGQKLFELAFVMICNMYTVDFIEILLHIQTLPYSLIGYLFSLSYMFWIVKIFL